MNFGCSIVIKRAPCLFKLVTGHVHKKPVGAILEPEKRLGAVSSCHVASHQSKVYLFGDQVIERQLEDDPLSASIGGKLSDVLGKQAAAHSVLSDRGEANRDGRRLVSRDALALI